tara:strand:+ start:2214 stop:2795 length:582 start_codon:yes stop_codon:yes gene_type:complete
MGIVKKINTNNCTIAIWDLKESYSELLKLSNTHDLPKYKTEKRKKEFLASRLLLNEIQPNQSISYNQYGAPEIKNEKHISISHSKNLVAIAVSDKRVGLDLEYISDKALRLSSKFISKDHQINLSNEKATLIWCLKETIYKWYQKGNIDFINDIKISPFTVSKKGHLVAMFKKKKLSLRYTRIDSYFLVYICK